MKYPEEHINEEERLKDLAAYQIMDTESEEQYDRIAELAAQICGTSISLISLLDENRQWFKSCIGMNTRETNKDYAFCAHAINDPSEVFIVENAKEDERFSDNPLVLGEPKVTFYAGVSLRSSNGNPLGTLCVLDQEPKSLNDFQLNALKTLADNVMSLMELRRKNFMIEKINRRLLEKNEEIEQFASRAAHDIKAPLRSIKNLLGLLSRNKELDEKKSKEIIELVISSSENLDDLVDGLLEFSRVDEIKPSNKTEIDLDHLIRELNSSFDFNSDYSLTNTSKVNNVHTNKAGFSFVLRNLISNAIKYNDKEETIINIRLNEKNGFYHCSVEDNGPGIPPKDQDRLFAPFEVLHDTDQFGHQGTGLGLASVRKVILKMGGEIYVASELGIGSTFHFKVPK